MRLRNRILLTYLAFGLVLALVAGWGSSAAGSTAHFTGTLPNGASWVADVPSSWNGILVLYSHGFGPPLPANAPDAGTRDALLARGYALAGSSYDPAGSWWALNTAVEDQFATIGAVTAAGLPHPPERVLAFGTSMGGLVSALEAERGAGVIDGALSTCGIVVRSDCCRTGARNRSPRNDRGASAVPGCVIQHRSRERCFGEPAKDAGDCSARCCADGST